MNVTVAATTPTPEEFDIYQYLTTPSPVNLAGYNQLCSEFNLGTDKFDVCGAIVLRMGTAAYAGFSLFHGFHSSLLLSSLFSLSLSFSFF